MKKYKVSLSLILFTIILLICFANYNLYANEAVPYRLKENVVYAKDHGVGYIMNVYTPTEKLNGLAIVHVMNGGWFSHDGLVEHFTKDFRLFDNLCSHGYTVFSVWTDSKTRFTCEDMLGQIQTAIRWVKANADKYKINPQWLGITGSSAGGQLALMAVMNNKDYAPELARELKKYNTRVDAIGLMFPVTDLTKQPEITEHEYIKMYGKILFINGLDGYSDHKILTKAKELSPLYHVYSDMPPVFIAQGDKDSLYKTTLSFVEAVRLKGGNVELVIVKDAGHNWPTMYVEVGKMAKWFDNTFDNK